MEAARPARPADVARLAELWRAAWEELHSMRGGDVFFAQTGRPEPVATSLDADLSDPGRGVWVGTIHETVVGYAAGRVERLGDDTCIGVITELFVEPGARSVGVGEALMGMMLGWFSERDCRGVDATALPGHRATKNFFEESGFTARLLVMHHRLDRANRVEQVYRVGPVDRVEPVGRVEPVDRVDGLVRLGLDGLEGLDGRDGRDGLDG